ncbi:MAG: hypothetical protein HWN80_18590 [Candidatus Lokiarchaeota archaeon]|nr:hypothetical protein [Candidatus Lokiarchaeota archaeon]
MREFTEKEKENKNKSVKIKEKISENVSTSFENEFQPDSRFEEINELENDFIPFDENSNTSDAVENNFEPIDDVESKQNPSLNIHPDEYRRIRDEKQAEDVDKKYIKEKYIKNGKPIEIPKLTSKENTNIVRKAPQETKKVRQKKTYVVLEENSELAEMVSIILGDGSIPKTKNRVRITLNKTEEPQYRKFVYGFMEKLFKKKPSIYKPRDANAVKMSINSKEVVRALINKGLKPGDKKKHQVEVPQWIKKEEENRRGSLRGLIDTDGSIHIHKYNKSIRITFKNASLRLINDYREMCDTFNISTQKIFYDKIKDNFDTQIETKKDIVNFIEKIKPRKWEYRAKTLGLVLKSISDPKKRKLIENELIKPYPDKKVHYSNKYYSHLKRLCEKYGYDASDDSIFNELENALTYSDNWTRLKRAQRDYLNEKAKNVIKDLKKKFK